MIIDAHLHVWSLDTESYPWSPIGAYIPEKRASIEDFMRQMDDAQVERAVIVQPTPYGWDNSYLMDVCRERKDRFRTVVLVDPLADDCVEKLTALIDSGADGLRINLHLLSESYAENDNFWNLLKTAENADIPICFQLTPEHFNIIQIIANRYQGTKIILDHMARPYTGTRTDNPLFAQFLSLEKYKNVFVKLSGLYYFSVQPPPYIDTWPLLKAACEHFKAERCIWGSDFPFINDRWNYLEFLETMKNDLEFTPTQLSWILSGTAESIWWRKDSGE